MYNRLKRSIAIVCLAVPLPFSVLAAGTATIHGSNGDRFTLEYDGSQMRLQSEKQRNVHLIANGSSIYAVTQAGGQPVVVSGNAVMGLLSASSGRKQFASGSEDIQEFIGLKSTGRSETVGGIAGKVHTLEYIDRAGKRRSEEVVLSEHAEVAEMTNRFGRIAATFQQNSGVDNAGAQQLLRELDRRKMGILRFADHYRLESLNTATPSQARFQLPAAPMQLPALQGLEALVPGLTGRR